MTRAITRCEHGVRTGGDFMDRERGTTVAACVRCAARSQPRRASWGLVLLALLALALIVLPVLAFAQGGMGTNEGAIAVQQNGAVVGDCDTLNALAPGLTVTIDGSTCTLTAAGGGGSGAASYLAFSSCGVIDGTVPVFLGPSACADQAEARAVGRVKNAATMGQLACVLSATTGSRTVTITGRSGVCGGALTDTSVVCTIGAGQTVCDSGGSMMPVTAGHCVSLRVATSGALPGDRVLTCLMERLS